MTETRAPEDMTVLERANMALIRYPRFKELHQEIRLCQQLSQVSGEPQCISLTGLAGAGKSTLVLDYTALFPRVKTPTGMDIPVFYMETPSPVTVKGMSETMLEELGDPAAHRGTQSQLNSRLIHLLKVCKTELVILDDFHHLVNTPTTRVLALVSDWLKVLIKKSGLPFMVVGIRGEVEPILHSNAQLSRLFATRETLEPFHWNPERPKTIEEFRRFVEYAECAIEMPMPTEIPRLELLYRLYYATDGIVGNLMNLLRRAAVVARQEGAPTLDLRLLALAFEKRLAQHLRGKENPFATAADALFVPQGAASSGGDAASAVGNRNKGAAKPPSVKTVLTSS